MAQQRTVGYWLKLVDGLINDQFKVTVEEHGVTRREWQLMNVLASQPATATELSQALAPFASESSDDEAENPLEELTESHWIALEGEKYSLTELGQTSLAKIGEVVESNREQIGAGIAPEDYETTLRVLEQMAHNLGWQDPRG